MRDDRKEALKKAKQNLLSFLLRKGRKYSGNPHRRTGPFRKPHERYSRGPAAPELENQDVR